MERPLRDVEVHHVDLDVDDQPSDGPAEFVPIELAERWRDLERHTDRASQIARPARDVQRHRDVRHAAVLIAATERAGP